VSAQTARYLRVMLTPQNPDGSPAELHPSIAALSPRARHLWEALSNLVFPEDNARVIPVAVLAQRLGISPANVRRARAELVAAGVIAVDTGGGADANRYRFPLAPPVEDVHTPRATARGQASTPRAQAREDPARLRAIQDPSKSHVLTSPDAVPRAAAPNGFGGWSSGRRRYGPPGPNKRATQ
jgi:hypothetical protein